MQQVHNPSTPSYLPTGGAVDLRGPIEQFRDGLKGGDIAASQQRTAHRRGRVDVWLGEALNLHDATVQLRDRLKGHDPAAGGPVELRITNVSPARW
jgi:hypothetical protein